jgi:hypothetical protein
MHTIQSTQNRSSGLSLAASSFAEQLGTKPGDERAALERLRALAKTCVIRFGFPGDIASNLPEVFDIPPHSSLRRFPGGIEVEPRWTRLLAALTLPREGDLSFEPPIRLTGEQERSALEAAIAGLVSDLRAANLQLIDPCTVAELVDYQSEFSAVLTKTWRSIESEPTSQRKELLIQSLRQFMNCLQEGDTWALVTPKEQVLLRAFADTVRAVSAGDLMPDLAAKEIVPSASLLAHLGMIWKWDEKLSSWGPQLPHSRYKNSSLFSLPSHALGSDKMEQLDARARDFIQSLQGARELYEKGDYKASELRVAQLAALRKALRDR